MEKPLSLTKTCSSCGQLKPLAAFLQHSGPDASNYGTICADCRKANLDKPKLLEEEGSSKSDSGFKVDTKARMAGEQDKRKLRTDTEEQYFEERDEKEVAQTKHLEKGELKTKDEKKHRDFLTTRTFLTDKKPVTTQSQKIERAQIESAQNIEQTEKQTQATKEEQKEKEIGTDSSLDTGIAGKIKYTQGQAFKEFARWSGSALGRTFAQPNKPDANKAETPSEFIEKTWGPNSRGKK